MGDENQLREELATIREEMNDPSLTQPEYKKLRQRQIEIMRKLP